MGTPATIAAVSSTGLPARGDAAPALRPPLQIHLHRTAIRGGKPDRHGVWQRVLLQHQDGAVATLAREPMSVEAMFRNVDRDPQTLYRLEVLDAAGTGMDDATAEIDREHLRCMREVLRKDRHALLKTNDALAAPFVQAAIAANLAVEAPPR